MTQTVIIGIAGGIGSGKSVVSRALRLMGYDVYDCDLEARRIMHANREVFNGIVDHFGPECVAADGTLDRRHIACRVFSDAQELEWLNALVHKAVREDVLAVAGEPRSKDNILFVESAILVGSGLADMCSRIWLVTAPRELRIQRAMTRDGATREAVLSRMDAQAREEELVAPRATDIIDNGGGESLLGQIEACLRGLNTTNLNLKEFDNNIE